MRLYEVGVILRADLSDEDRQAELDDIKTRIETGGGSVVNVDHWGRRRLEYLIERQREGYYVFYKAQMPPALPAELERAMTFNERILRYLVIRDDE